jgi:hypothetical protein
VGSTGGYQNPCRTFAEVSYALLCTVMQFATDVTAKKQCKFKDLVPSEPTNHIWTLPGLQGSFFALTEQVRLQPYIRPSVEELMGGASDY